MPFKHIVLALFLVPFGAVAQNEIEIPPPETGTKLFPIREAIDNLSFGPVVSGDYYWIRTDAESDEMVDSEQKTAATDLVDCRNELERSSNGQPTMLALVEEKIRVCMQNRGWNRKFMYPQVVL